MHVATTGSLAQLRVQDTEEQGQNWQIENGEAKRKQLLVKPTEELTESEWLPGEHLNGSECFFFFTHEISYLFSLDQ